MPFPIVFNTMSVAGLWQKQSSIIKKLRHLRQEKNTFGLHLKKIKILSFTHVLYEFISSAGHKRRFYF